MLTFRFCSMPVEHVNVLFKPNSFFDKNPSMDVPGTKDAYSTPAFTNRYHRYGVNGFTNGYANSTNGFACCGH